MRRELLQSKPTWRASPPVRARADCTLCHGTGWKLTSERGVCRARRCGCGALIRLVQLKEAVRIPMTHQECTLDSYRPETGSQARALEAARRFAARYPQVDRGLFLTGNPGVGKTHLAVGIARQLMHRYHDDILFVDFAAEFCSSGWRPRAGRPEGLRAVSLLILDNFGAEAPSPACVKSTERLIEDRSAAGRPTVFTGGPVRCRELFLPRRADPISPTQSLLMALSLPSRMRLLSGVRLLALWDEAPQRADSLPRALFA